MKHAIERKGRKARKEFLVLLFAGFAGLAFFVCAVITLAAQSPSAPASGEWRSYAGDLRNHHYSPLSQVTAGNFQALEVAWRFKTDSLGPRPEYKLGNWLPGQFN